MGDAGEGLIDADSRIQERMEELERERVKSQVRDVRAPEALRQLESLRLARTELERQLTATARAAARPDWPGDGRNRSAHGETTRCSTPDQRRVTRRAVTRFACSTPIFFDRAERR